MAMVRFVLIISAAAVVVLVIAIVVLDTLAVGPVPQLVEKVLPNRTLPSR